MLKEIDVFSWRTGWVQRLNIRAWRILILRGRWKRKLLKEIAREVREIVKEQGMGISNWRLQIVLIRKKTSIGSNATEGANKVSTRILKHLLYWCLTLCWLWWRILRQKALQSNWGANIHIQLICEYQPQGKQYVLLFYLVS